MQPNPSRLPTPAERADALAEKRCREVGIATMLVGVLPLMGAISGLLLPLVSMSARLQVLPILVPLVLAGAFMGLGRAMWKRVRWSFKAAMVVFTLIALGGLVGVIAAETAGFALRLFIGLPLVFAASAFWAEQAVIEHERAIERG